MVTIIADFFEIDKFYSDRVNYWSVQDYMEIGCLTENKGGLNVWNQNTGPCKPDAG